ncbi:MAG: hypothetical protein K0S23_3087 [Fluviicola sp.]|jgi:hypothetical protein|uniref:hypothetical protein n=1 Tax=Fluviicola sp. TaxID=1917219 RepID=UPI0026252DF8|nr:hypothetical protein [Fluviicola sp.]MDF3028780.1 hypothetical protein [Fluviicola sp.]
MDASRNWFEKLDGYNYEVLLLQNHLEEVAGRNKQEDVQIVVEKFRSQLTGCIKSINEIKHQFTEINIVQDTVENSLAAHHRSVEFREAEEKVITILEKVFQELSSEFSRLISK